MIEGDTDRGLGAEPSDDEEEGPFSTEKRPPVLRDEAYHGPVGDAVRILTPTTEATPAAMLLTMLIGFGNLAGSIAHTAIGNTKHHARLYGVIVGPSSIGRKGMSYNEACRLFSMVDPDWFRDCRKSGHASGEGLIGNFRKPEDEESENVVIENRNFAREAEFSRLLKASSREASILSEIYRDAYDDGRMQIHRSKESIVVDDVHIALLGHITDEELRERLTTLEICNGFANRFLYCWSDRTKKLYRGGIPDMGRLEEIAQRIKTSIANARENVFDFTPDADAAYKTFYESIEKGRGLIGELTARAEPNVLRLCVAYAILDGGQFITLDHVRAAIAFSDYSKECVNFIFADSCADPNQERIFDFLIDAGTHGRTREEISHLFNRNLSSRVIRTACDELEKAGFITWKEERGKGPVTRRYFAIERRKSKRPPPQTNSKSFRESPS